MVTPVADLPPKPWRDIPTLNYVAMGRMRAFCAVI